MGTWVLLLRGINVGGRNALSMKELTDVLESLGLEDVRTYIQSGNVVFRSSGDVSPDLEDDVARAVEERRGFRPRVLLLGADRLERAARSNPFPQAEAEPKSLHLFFLSSTPSDPDLEALEEARASSERFRLDGDVLYLHAPDGVGRSRLASGVERHLGVQATARNWRTVEKLREMALEASGR